MNPERFEITKKYANILSKNGMKPPALIRSICEGLDFHWSPEIARNVVKTNSYDEYIELVRKGYQPKPKLQEATEPKEDGPKKRTDADKLIEAIYILKAHIARQTEVQERIAAALELIAKDSGTVCAMLVNDKAPGEVSKQEDDSVVI